MMTSKQLIDKWKKRLLDLGKRNRLINYRETKRSNIKIIAPEVQELYARLVLKEEKLIFPYSEEDFDESDRLPEVKLRLNGNLLTDRTVSEQQKTLRSLRSRAKTAVEEQGVNILYLSFGFLHWKENDVSDIVLVSPIILVPVTLTLESITSPYVLGLHEDEIVVNPTLAHKMENDFGLKIPEFDSDEGDTVSYFEYLNTLVLQNGWKVCPDVALSLFSFLKINMYNDLENNREKILTNPVVKAWSGDISEITTLPEEFNNIDHDNHEKPVSIFQVVDADSSQQDAILYSKKGVSFVLQGPPGTGKSQTITNIIAEGLAEGKKILFVSEKMAALEVVLKRLIQVGLSDYCLPLHSHRANKKEVLTELGRTLNLNKVRLQEDALYQLELLKIQRDKLNQYDRELHIPCHPLGKTIFEVNGILANLYNTPDVIFTLDNVGETTLEKLNQYKHLLSDFSRTVENMRTDYTDNPWRGCQVPNVTHELRHDIETNLRKLIPLVKRLADQTYGTINELGLEYSLSLGFIWDLLEILEVGSKSPTVPSTWLYKEDLTPLFEKAKEYRNLTAEYHELQQTISQDFNPEFFTLPANNLHSNFITSITTAKRFINSSNYSTENEISTSAQSIVSALHISFEKIELIAHISQAAASLLGTNSIENIKDAKNLEEVLESLLSDVRPSLEWFEPDKFRLVRQLMPKARKMYDEIDIETKSILSKFDREIFDIDSFEMLKRFRTEYTSIFKILKKQYREDRKSIKLLSTETDKKLDDETIINVLSELKGVAEKKAWLAEKEELLKSLFGSHYQNEYTDWDAFESAVSNFERIRDFFGPSGVHPKTREILLSGGHTKELELLRECFTRVWESNFPSVITQTIEISYNIEDGKLKELRSALETALATMRQVANSFDMIRKFRKRDIGYEELLENLSKLVRWQKILVQIANQSEDLKAYYLFLFNGIDTDWERIITSLSWINDFKKIKEKYDLPSNFITRICEDVSFPKNVGTHLYVIKSNLQITGPILKWYLSLFDNNRDYFSLELYALLSRIENCSVSLSALEEWIDFRRSREKCREAGLSDYIEKVQTLSLDRSYILPAFLKRFFRLWLDSVMPNFPAVLSFRRRMHEEVVEEFNKLDNAQLLIARSRIRERLAANLPDLNRLTHSFDEVGLLRRELNKQRRIMPLRKLFRAIPNLLLTIKPCLLMSPLSVSLFLESANYHFDIVVFDEASQVCTEDAIGAIIRGSQVIITGDSKQLPPTNFFTASISDTEFDVDDVDEDEYDDTDAYESVLEEAATVLPERTLRWHYRSRHENLISFSNEKVYNNNLITFPSPINNEQNIGVEYIQVPDVVYDRGGKRNNITEAKKVAETVFESIKKYPNRSLGVVTFSESQQQAVETAIRQLRLLNQYLEDFFREDREEPFFVKNLENVQGDERDTILISIGYAKDSNGVMSMNFGPLNRSGGYRRLNVAITRAKYNVKLIGSINPTDIAIEKTNSEGVKLLRSYIEFAKNGDRALRRELTVSETVNVESPFEEAVYNFLSGKGYNLSTQVGCSGYRIDLAVKHPALNGRYVLGIECDGAQYHSARTARERDRLRQTILEDFGWKIYRIWSTDWIKDPITEGQKLCDAVDAAITSYSENTFTVVKKKEQRLEGINFSLEIPTKAVKLLDANEANPYNFDYYKEANIYRIRQTANRDKYLAKVLKHIVLQEYPVHFDLLCKRVTPLFGNQKASSTVRNNVATILERYLEKDIEFRGMFCWPTNKYLVKVRIPEPNGVGRKIEYISTEEIAEAMYVIASKSVGISRKDLLITTARVFGFNRTGANISLAMQRACDYLLRINRVKEVDEKVIPINNISQS